MRKVETKIKKKRFSNEIDEQETLERQDIKTRKIDEHNIRTEPIKDTTNREIEELRIERINKINQNKKNKNSNEITKDGNKN